MPQFLEAEVVLHRKRREAVFVRHLERNRLADQTVVRIRQNEGGRRSLGGDEADQNG
jgi:hypothetical protein